jgi:hypothetical protein
MKRAFDAHLLVDSLSAIRLRRMPFARLFCPFYHFYHSTNELVGVNAACPRPRGDEIPGKRAGEDKSPPLRMATNIMSRHRLQANASFFIGQSYKIFIKNVKNTLKYDTSFFLIRHYLWYNWYMTIHGCMAKTYIA